MITVVLNILIAVAVIILTYSTVIHKLLISRQMSDKYYKNFGLGILGFAVYINCTIVIISSMDCNWMISTLKSGDIPLEEVSDMANNLINSLNQMSAGVIASIVFYALTLLLLKSIEKDIQKDFAKPKYRWVP
jgi:hypothetical protein